MAFINFIFLIIFLIAFLSRLIFNQEKYRPVLILSLVFISCLFFFWCEQTELINQFEFKTPQPWDILLEFIVVMVVSIVINYIGAIGLGRITHKTYRRNLLFFLIFLNLAVLAYYKYTNFIEVNLAALSGGRLMLSHKVVASPLGISYYTFAVISYLVDVYFNRTQVQKNPVNVLLFFGFFPKMIAGPIIRAADFFKQLEEGNRLNLSIINESIFLFVQGAFLKIVCADNLAVIVDANWQMGTTPGSHGLDLLLLAVLYAVQLFCDFSGYTQMARGIALALGFRLPINFLYPFTANSFSTFWRNWHISLYEWVRVYLFYPLERISRNRLWLSITPVIVMLLTGLWHGGNWTFVIWGLLHGTGMSVERIFGLNRPDVNRLSRILWAIMSQAAILIGWIIFRSPDISSAITYLQTMLSGLSSPDLFGFTSNFLRSAFPMIAAWRIQPEAKLIDSVIPIFLDLLPFLTVLIIHIFGWGTSQKKDHPTFSLSRAILTGILLFLTLTAYPVIIGRPLYGDF